MSATKAVNKNTNQPEKETSKEHKIFSEYPVAKAVAIMVIPCVISQIISVIYNIADTWLLGRVNNPAAIAGVSLCMPISNIKTAIANLFGIGAASVIARALGEKNVEKAKNTFAIAVRFGIIFLAVYCALFATVLKPFLLLIGGDGSNINYATQYSFIVIVLGGVPTALSYIFSHLIRSTGRAKISSFGVILGAVLNIILDPLFMFVLLPKGYEVIGTAIGTSISGLVSMLFFVIYIAKQKSEPIFQYKTNKDADNKGILKEILKCGLPSFLILTASQVSNFFLNAMLATMSSSAIAGVGIVRKIDSLAYFVNQGITQGMLPIVAYCYGEGKYQRMKSVALFCSVCTIIFSLLCSVISYIFAPQLVGVFINDPETIAYGTSFLRVLCIAVGIYPLLLVIIALFQAVGESIRPLILSILRKGSLDIICFFIIKAIFGVEYILWATPIISAVALIIGLIMLFVYFNKLTAKGKTNK